MELKNQEDLASYFANIEASKGVRVIGVVKVGSWAWGYAHPDSDLDLRYIYVQLPWLRGLQDTSDTLSEITTLTLDGERRPVDLQGFELRKFVNLLTKSDMNMAEVITRMPLEGSLVSQDAHMLERVFDYHRNPSILFTSAWHQAKRYLQVDGPTRKREPLTCKALLHSLRFLLICRTLQSTHIRFEPVLTSLLRIYKDAYPWASEYANWLNEDRSRGLGALMAHEGSHELMALYQEVDLGTRPVCDRVQSNGYAQEVYARICYDTIIRSSKSGSCELFK